MGIGPEIERGLAVQVVVCLVVMCGCVHGQEANEIKGGGAEFRVVMHELWRRMQRLVG